MKRRRMEKCRDEDRYTLIREEEPPGLRDTIEGGERRKTLWEGEEKRKVNEWTLGCCWKSQLLEVEGKQDDGGEVDRNGLAPSFP